MRARCAFTLIEVLVVVAIIALLIAILLPLLMRSKESTRRLQCASNLHSVGQAALAIAIDSDGFLPDRASGHPTPPQCAWLNGGGDDRPLFEGYLAGYTAETSCEAFYCPSYEGGIHSLAEGWPHHRPGITAYLWGYIYYANYKYDANWIASTEVPKTVEDKNNPVIFSDLLEQFQDPNRGWQHASHTKGGQAGGTDLGNQLDPEGFNNNYLDGSTQWVEYSPGSKAFEPAVRLGGSTYFYWGIDQP